MNKVVDTHTHSSTFSDGSLTPEQIVERAKGKGYKVGIADHLSRFHKIKTDEHLERYISYLDTLPCYKAGELDLGQETMFATELLNRLDYIIGGVHNLFWERRWQCIWFMKEKIENPAGFMDLYRGALLKAISSPVVPFQILAHPTKLPPYLADNFREEDVISDEWLEEILLEARKHNLAVEMNNTERVPSERFLRKALSMGLRISLGSDGHSEQGTCNLDWCLEMAARIGIREESLFQPTGGNV